MAMHKRHIYYSHIALFTQLCLKSNLFIMIRVLAQFAYFLISMCKHIIQEVVTSLPVRVLVIPADFYAVMEGSLINTNTSYLMCFVLNVMHMFSTNNWEP